MACNCLCCGCVNCTEGQEGKCCCGGSSGTCCQAGEFCCSGTCCQPGEFCCSGVCTPGGCCECEDGTNGPVTECTTSEVVCIEYTYAGANCNPNNVGQSFYSQTGALLYRPCASQVATGVRAFPCGGNTPDAFDIAGYPSCTTVVYDENCACEASGCDWVDIVASWQDIWGGGQGQCDCIIELVSYTMQQSGDTCP